MKIILSLLLILLLICRIILIPVAILGDLINITIGRDPDRIETLFYQIVWVFEEFIDMFENGN